MNRIHDRHVGIAACTANSSAEASSQLLGQRNAAWKENFHVDR
jgi:hypothetical protein